MTLPSGTTILYPDGTIRSRAARMTLADMQEAVRGYVDVVPVPILGRAAVLVVNADAHVVGAVFAPNARATSVAGQPIRGVAVLTDDPAWTGLEQEYLPGVSHEKGPDVI